MFARLREFFLHNRGTRQTIVKNVFWLSFGQIAGRVIRAAIIIYAARLLGAADYGVFSYVLGVAGFFTIFADIGVSNILTREASQNPERRLQIFATTFWIKAVLLTATALIMIFVAPSLSNIPAARVLIPFMALLTIFDGMRDFCLSYLRALEKMEIEAFINTFTNLAITVAGFVILTLSHTAGALTVAYVASSGLGTLVVLIIVRKQVSQIFSKFERSLVRPVLRAAVPIAVIGLLGTFMLNTDFVMLGWWRTATELGYYSAAQKVLQLLYILPAILAAAIFPAMSRFVRQAREAKIKELMEQAMRAVLFVAVPMAVGGVVLAKPLMVLLYGVEYAPAAAAFRFLVVTVLLVFPGTLLGNLSIAYNQQLRLAVPVILGSVANILFDILLIPPFGIAGCSAATIVALIFNNGLMWRIVRQRMIRFPTLRNLPRIAIATVIMAVVAWVLNARGISVVLTLFTSVAVYVGALFLLREPLVHELRTILQALRGREGLAEHPLP